MLGWRTQCDTSHVLDGVLAKLPSHPSTHNRERGERRVCIDGIRRLPWPQCPRIGIATLQKLTVGRTWRVHWGGVDVTHHHQRFVRRCGRGQRGNQFLSLRGLKERWYGWIFDFEVRIYYPVFLACNCDIDPDITTLVVDIPVGSGDRPQCIKIIASVRQYGLCARAAVIDNARRSADAGQYDIAIDETEESGNPGAIKVKWNSGTFRLTTAAAAS